MQQKKKNTVRAVKKIELKCIFFISIFYGEEKSYYVITCIVRCTEVLDPVQVILLKVVRHSCHQMKVDKGFDVQI